MLAFGHLVLHYEVILGLVANKINLLHVARDVLDAHMTDDSAVREREYQTIDLLHSAL